MKRGEWQVASGESQGKCYLPLATCYPLRS
ncbi:protein of unknown function [Candidatus Promineifilum breve]|uniref:Uncharacterized protein n=1 Tax=Candidatus Promineifilum breve TaxID=1806508 RepID=A0A160T835_9CHLR|nr:protein of unknown function [Candidatus Promineifilum breve]